MRLAFVVLAGAGVRLLYDLVVLHRLRLGIDASWYYLEGGVIRREHAFADPDLFATHRAATAAWPPLYPGFLALVQSVAGDSVRAGQVAGIATGSTTVALTGVIGRRIAGPWIGLVAAGLVAISPMMIAADGSMMSETLFVALALGTLLLALVAADAGRSWLWPAAGALAGLAALTRAEGLLLVPFVIAPVAWRGLRASLPRSALAVVTAGVAALVVVAPWVVRNAIRVDEPTIATVSSSTAIAGANCSETYFGENLGSWEFACIRDDLRLTTTEHDWTSTIRRDGLNYAADHASRWPVVGAARAARLWGFWDPVDQVGRESLETRNRTWQYVVIGTGFVTLALGAAGFVALARRKRAIDGLVGLVLMVTTVALLTYGNTRFRTTAEPALLIGVAAVAARFLHRGWSDTSTRPETSSRETTVAPSGNA